MKIEFCLILLSHANIKTTDIHTLKTDIMHFDLISCDSVIVIIIIKNIIQKKRIVL